MRLSFRSLIKREADIVRENQKVITEMSHDIRTPLNGIIGMNYLTVPKIGTDDKGALQNLKKMEITSKYLLKLINDILDMSKIESGKMEIANKAFSLEELLQNIKNMLEITAEKSGVQYIFPYQQRVQVSGRCASNQPNSDEPAF